MGKRYLDDLPALDLRSKEQGMKDFVASMRGLTSGCAIVSYAGFSGHVNFEATRCHYGGMRYWWLCPGCGQRRAVLRVLDGWLSCNGCIGKPFRSASITKSSRWADQRRKLLDRLGRDLHPLYEPLYEFQKPIHMHWRTYTRLAKRFNRLLDEEAGYMNRVCARANLPVLFVPV